MSKFISVNESNFCPPNYDGTYCWPATPCRSAVRLPCTIYEQKNKSISRWCSANIKQITNSSQTIFEWQPSNSTECAAIDSKAEANFLQPFPTPIIDVIDEELYVSVQMNHFVFQLSARNSISQAQLKKKSVLLCSTLVEWKRKLSLDVRKKFILIF